MPSRPQCGPAGYKAIGTKGPATVVPTLTLNSIYIIIARYYNHVKRSLSFNQKYNYVQLVTTGIIFVAFRGARQATALASTPGCCATRFTIADTAPTNASI